MSEYRVPTHDARAEFVEKKSRFIGRIWVTETEEEALDRIKQMRQQHWDATHNVYAYVIHDGPTRYTDDGEPQGTAGMPVLEVLRGQGLENVCCVVTRYFGGTLLGTGGLVRAYGRAAKDAVAAAGISVQRVWNTVDLFVPYNLYERVSKEIPRFEGQVIDTEFSADVGLHLIFPAVRTEEFLNRILDLPSGRVSGAVTGESFRPFPLIPPADPGAAE